MNAGPELENAVPEKQGQVGGFRGFLRRLGPGLITGAADDDPSGIGTHSQVGAEFGYGLSWTCLLYTSRCV